MTDDGDHAASGDYARLDTDRAARTGDPEVVYGAGKTPEQVVEILRTLHAAHPDRAVLATRLSDDGARRGARGAARRRRRRRSPGPSTLGPLPAARGTVAVVSRRHLRRPGRRPRPRSPPRVLRRRRRA